MFLLKRTGVPSEPQTDSFTASSENHLLPEMTPFGVACENHLPRDVPPFSVPIENGNQNAHLVAGPPRCTCGAEPLTVVPNFDPGFRRMNKNISFANSMDQGEHSCRPELLTCVSEEGLLGPCCQNMSEALGDNLSSQTRFKSYPNTCPQYNVIPHVLPRPYFDDEHFVPTFHTQSLPRRYFQTQPAVPHNTYNEIGSLPRGFSTQSCRRLRNSAAVSFSEPEGLARIGNQQYPSFNISTHSPHHTNASKSPHHYPHQQISMQENPPPIPPLAPRAPILRRPPLPPSRPPRQSYTVLEERTTSV